MRTLQILHLKPAKSINSKNQKLDSIPKHIDMNPNNIIDLDKVIAKSNSAILKKMPRFVINYFKRLIHQKELNEFIFQNKDKYNLDFIDAVMKYLNLDVKTIWLDEKIEKGSYIFICNHPLGGVDFFAAILSIADKVGPLKVLANEILMNFDNLKELFLPVNVFGRSPQRYYDMIHQAYSSDIAIMTFPAGEVSRKKNGIIKDSAWHRSFVRQAIEHKRNVVPVYIHAKNSRRFYNLGVLRNKLGIKLNLELMLLPDEMFRKRNETIPVVIGKPIHYSMFDKSLDNYNWAQYVKNRLYELQKYL